MKLDTHIGEEISVEVHFDYQPYERPTNTYPGAEASVTITEVRVDSDKDKDIFGILSEAVLEDLEGRCEEHALLVAEWP